MTANSRARAPWTVLLLAASILAGGLRDLRLAALGEAAVFAALWLERPPLGPAAAWLPWLAWALVSALASAQPLAAIPFLARWAAVLGFFSLAAAWDERSREAWLKAVLALSLVLAAAALWVGAPRGYLSEMTGLIPPYYNYTAFALAATAAAAVAWALHPRGPRAELRAAALAVALVSLACLVLARARAACLGLGFALTVWAIRRWGARAALAAGLAAGLAVGAFQAGLLPNAVTAAIVKKGRQNARPEIWRSAAAIARESPVLGEGPGDFGVGFRRHLVAVQGNPARWSYWTPYAHSEPLQAAAETGWVGLGLWLLALGASLRVLAGRTAKEPAREAAVVAVAAMTLHFVFDNMLQIPGLAMLYFSALAVAGAGSVSARRWTRAVAAAGALGALVAWVPRTLADGDPARASALFPAEVFPKEDLAYRAMRAGKIEAADSLWKEAESLAPFNAVYPWRRAQIAAARGRWSEAGVLAGRAVGIEPGFLRARVLRAEADARLGRPRQAREELAEVRKELRERGTRSNGIGYDMLIWTFDSKEYERASALAAGGAARR